MPLQKRLSTLDAPAKEVEHTRHPHRERETPSTAVYHHYDQSY